MIALKLDASVLTRMNTIFTAAGMNRFQVSQHFYQRPSTVHVLSTKDLQFLVFHQPMLLKHKGVKCDFKAFSVLLWSMLQEGDAVLSGLLAGFTTCRKNPLPSDGTSWWKRAGYTEEGKAEASTTLTRTWLVLWLLTGLMSRFGRKAVQEQVVLGLEDVRHVIRIAEKQRQLFLELGSLLESEADSAAAGVVKGKELQGLLKLVEEGLVLSQLLLAELPRPRAGMSSIVIVESVLKYFYHIQTWEASGLTLKATEGYGKALLHMILSLYGGERGGEGLLAGTHESLAKVICHRLMRRPGFRYLPFRWAYQGVDEGTEEGDGIDACFGLLKLFWAVKKALEELLCPISSYYPQVLNGEVRVDLSTKEQVGHRQVRAAARHLFSVEAEDVRKSGGKLSFHQLLGFSLFYGMPAMDLVPVEPLIQRAQATELISPHSVSKEEGAVMHPHTWGPCLRLLAAVCFTMRRTAAVGIVNQQKGFVIHDPLPLSSLLPLWEALETYVFYSDLLHQKVVNGGGGGRTNAIHFPPYSKKDVSELFLILNLIVGHPKLDQVGKLAETGEEVREPLKMTTHLLERWRLFGERLYAYFSLECSSAVGGGSVSAGLAASSLSSQRAGLASAPPINLRQRMWVEAVSDTLREALVVACVASKVFPPADLPRALEAAAYLYAVFTARVLRTSGLGDAAGGLAGALMQAARESLESKEQKKFVSMLQSIPPVMRVADVDAFFIDHLVPLVIPTPSAHSSSSPAFPPQSIMALARLEAHLVIYGSSTAAYSVSTAHMLQHWAPVGVACLTKLPATAAYTPVLLAAYDFLVAPMLSKHIAAPLLLPMLCAVLVPSSSLEASVSAGAAATLPRHEAYREPPMPLLAHFARSIRTVCRCLSECDAVALKEQLADPNSAVCSTLQKVLKEGGCGEEEAVRIVSSFQNSITPNNTILLLISSLFDKLCFMVHQKVDTPSPQQASSSVSLTTPPPNAGSASPAEPPAVHWKRLGMNYTALSFLLNSNQEELIPRVCVSLEALLLEHMRGKPKLQEACMRFLSKSISVGSAGPLKRNVVEWYMELEKKLKLQGKL